MKMPTQNTQAANPRLAVKNPVDPAIAGLLNAATSTGSGQPGLGALAGEGGPAPAELGPNPTPFEPLPSTKESANPFAAGNAYGGSGSGPWDWPTPPYSGSPFRSSTLDSMGGGAVRGYSAPASNTPAPVEDPYDALFKKQEYEKRIAEMAQQALSAQENSAMAPLRQKQMQANINATDMNTNATNANIQNQIDELELNRRRYNSGGPLAGLWRQQYNTSNVG
jgi:hypothetical protein